MLSTILAGYPWLAPAALAALALLSPPIGALLVGRPRAAWTLAALAVLAVLVATLSPTGRELEAGCVLVVEARLTAPEPLANVVLTVPLALLVGVASRRPALGAAVTIVLALAIEAVQALVPALGRSCAADDALANGVGAAVGALLAVAALAIARRARPGADRPADRRIRTPQ
ncbi:VanZ family protein [Agrococcus sp. TF02-05]|uniref:VanZ family protein n=1 Tax=Agrococcus sp. TF02-05 TaxID=2815211 RepID=UPI001AA0B311|nr:VanZ family protein [Agrococcus sp. TF02-05]MBO1770940.1 VanZ family protein [Agrococcus sp. TF02-05]